MNYTGGESLSTGTGMQSSAPVCFETQEDEASIVAAIRRGTDTHLQQRLYVKYRRPLLQILQHRGISFDLAQDLVQRTFLIALKKIHTEGLEDPSNLGGYLYRTACNLAARHWRGTLAHPFEPDAEETLSNLPDEALSLEERLDHEILARSVRSLMQRLHHARDREVLQRYYLLEEPKEAICRSLRLTELQFNQVLFRARQRFGDILRRNGYAIAL